MTIGDPAQIEAILGRIADAAALRDEGALAERSAALADLGFAEELVRRRAPAADRPGLLRRLDRLRADLTALDQRLFARLRAAIRAGELPPPALRRLLDRYTAYVPGQHIHIRPEALDRLVAGICGAEQPGVAGHPILPDGAPETRRSTEMVHLEITPARALLDLADRTGLGPADTFYDLGSGLGQIAILAHLLSGCRAIGVEIEPAYVAAARASSQALGLSAVAWVEADARTVDYAAGTVFFMFTPFRGGLLAAVLERLREAAARHPILVCTYGSCTLQVAGADWLRSLDGHDGDEFALALFASR